MFFKIEGFAGKRSLLSPPPPPSFHRFALAPFFTRGPNFVRFVRERLLRRLETCSIGDIRLDFKMANVQYIFMEAWVLQKESAALRNFKAVGASEQPGNQYIYVDLLYGISLCVWLLQSEFAGQKRCIALLNGGA